MGEPALDPVGGNGIRIVYPVEEGAATRSAPSEVRGATPHRYSFAQLLSRCPSPAAWSPPKAEMEKGRSAIRDYYGARGFIAPASNPHEVPAAGNVNVVYEVDEGHFTTLRDIRIVSAPHQGQGDPAGKSP
ncbi:MAG: hypothetical protein U1F87_12700 [Kiritimatiellia bacterium]